MDGSIAATDPRPRGTMHVETVPYDEDRRAELPPELAKEAEQVMGDDVLVREEAKVKSHLASSGRDGKRGDHRDALMGAPALIENGCPADRCPGASNERGHKKATLIEENNAGPQSPGVFLPGAIRSVPTPESLPHPAPVPGARASGG